MAAKIQIIWQKSVFLHEKESFSQKQDMLYNNIEI